MKRGAAPLTTPRSMTTAVLFGLLTLILNMELVHARTVAEEELVLAFLGTGSAKAIAAAARARHRAAGLTEPYLPKPDLLLRREQSFGSATEFSTTVAGLSVSLEIGGRHALRKRAASLDAKALEFERRAEVVETLCGLRRKIQAAYATQQTVALLSASQQPLVRLAKNLNRLVTAGERSRFDYDRVLLLVRTHHRTLVKHQARLSGLLAELSSLSGLAVTEVSLGSASPRTTSDKTVTPDFLRALRLQARAEKIREVEARRSWIPNLEPYGAYRLDQGGGGSRGHGYEVGLTLNLPVPSHGRVAQAAAESRQKTLLAQATRQQAIRAARLASLASSAKELNRSIADNAGDPAKLVQDATRRYLTGVGPLAELLDATRAAEEAALQQASAKSALRSIALETACLRGVFDNKRLNRLAKEESP